MRIQSFIIAALCICVLAIGYRQWSMEQRLGQQPHLCVVDWNGILNPANWKDAAEQTAAISTTNELIERLAALGVTVIDNGAVIRAGQMDMVSVERVASLLRSRNAHAAAAPPPAGGGQ